MRPIAFPLSRAPARWRIALVALYLAVILPLLMFFNVGLTPDSLAFVFLGAALLSGRLMLFLRDWGVFLLVVILWQQTGPVAKWVGFPVQETPLVNADRFIMQPFLHGALPQVWLQQHLYHAGHWQWYDIMSWAVYGLHFPEPLIVGFAIWMSTREGFRHFSVAFLTLAAMAFAIYIVYPAVPPWMAGSPQPRYRLLHVIPNVHKIFSDFNDSVLQQQFGHHYKRVLDVRYNLTGAMPSLHAAFPLLSALYLRKTFGKWGLLMLVYAAVVWFAVVYMAEHWVIDVLVGLVCAVLAYALVEGVSALWAARTRQRESTNEAAAAAMSAFSHKAGPGR